MVDYSSESLADSSFQLLFCICISSSSTPAAEPSDETKPKLKPPVKKHNPFLDGCRHISAYKKESRISEGTYGIVWKAVDKETCVTKDIHLDHFKCLSVRHTAQCITFIKDIVIS